MANTKVDTSSKMAQLRARLEKKLQGRNVPVVPLEAPRVQIAKPNTTTSRDVLVEEATWKDVMDAVRRAIKHVTVANQQAAIELLKAFEYSHGLPANMFGQDTAKLRGLFAAMIAHETATDEEDVGTYPAQIIEEFKTLLESEEDIPELAERSQNDGFRGRTIRPMVGDVIRSGFNFFAQSETGERKYNFASPNDEARYVVVTAGLGRGNLVDSWVITLRVLVERKYDDTKPVFVAHTSAVMAGEELDRTKASRIYGDNPNGFVVVDQKRMTFI